MTDRTDLKGITELELLTAFVAWFSGSDPNAAWPTDDPCEQAAIATAYVRVRVRERRREVLERMYHWPHDDSVSGHLAAVRQEAFSAWLQQEMPEGTVIISPSWWAPRILKAVDRASPQRSSSVEPGDEYLGSLLRRVRDHQNARKVLISVCDASGKITKYQSDARSLLAALAKLDDTSEGGEGGE